MSPRESNGKMIEQRNGKITYSKPENGSVLPPGNAGNGFIHHQGSSYRAADHVQQNAGHGIDEHLVEFSEALRTVAKALRRVSEAKAAAQAEAVEWKRKYEEEKARNLQLEQRGNEICPRNLCSWSCISSDNAVKLVKVFLPCLLSCGNLKEHDRLEGLLNGEHNLNSNITENITSRSISYNQTKEQYGSCCAKHGICSHDVLRDRETDSNSETIQPVMMRKASFKLSWENKGEKCDQQKRDIVFFGRGNITTAERSSKQISLRWESPPQTVLILSKPNSTSVRILCTEMVRWLKEQRSLDIFVEPRVRAELLTESSYFGFVQTWKDDKEMLLLHRNVDLVITLGGDGTVLWAASMFKGPVPPVVPFSLGSLGFMTPFHSENYRDYLDSILRGPFSITLRHRLQCHIISESAKSECETDEPILVLNEVTIDRGISSFLTNLECYCDNYFVTSVQGDGLILSTTSGSTAYSLAAGGSMVHPQVPAILFTPICPHSLSFRPLILPEYVVLRVQVPYNSRSHAWASFDGKDRRKLAPGDALVCSMSPWPVPTACQAESTGDFLRSIHEGLHWNLRKTQSFDGPRDL